MCLLVECCWSMHDQWVLLCQRISTCTSDSAVLHVHCPIMLLWKVLSSEIMVLFGPKKSGNWELLVTDVRPVEKRVAVNCLWARKSCLAMQHVTLRMQLGHPYSELPDFCSWREVLIMTTKICLPDNSPRREIFLCFVEGTIIWSLSA